MYLRNRPSELARTNRGSAKAFAELDASQGALMEHLLPGWRESMAESNVKIDASMQKEFEKSVAELNMELETPIKPELRLLWSRLGGQLPEPERA